MTSSLLFHITNIVATCKNFAVKKHIYFSLNYTTDIFTWYNFCDLNLGLQRFYTLFKGRWIIYIYHSSPATGMKIQHLLLLNPSENI